ncbi:MAG: transporter ATP-binding protein [Herbinix sp.]|jgi:branched-chain amino acid transport system ATP-binding protein|nr:transporter ATP-binding protein [Herbinix sp.]
MLSIKDLHVSYGAIHAIHGVSLEVNDGEIVTLIGANGAGKTTILHTVTGLKIANSGTISYGDLDLRATDASKLIKYGISHVPEGRHIFPDMTVLENLEMGAYSTKKNRRELEKNFTLVFERFPRLKERYKQLAGTLSGGEQQMLAMGRALMADPKILLLDEPSMGLSPILVKEIFSIIRYCHEIGITILLVEQNAKMALGIADRAYVLETGNITISGKAKELLEDDRVRKAYLGQ